MKSLYSASGSLENNTKFIWQGEKIPTGNDAAVEAAAKKERKHEELGKKLIELSKQDTTKEFRGLSKSLTAGRIRRAITTREQKRQENECMLLLMKSATNFIKELNIDEVTEKHVKSIEEMDKDFKIQDKRLKEEVETFKQTFVELPLFNREVELQVDKMKVKLLEETKRLIESKPEDNSDIIKEIDGKIKKMSEK